MVYVVMELREMNEPYLYSRWTRREVLTLIHLYKAHPVLYDTNHQDYYNRQIREQVLDVIRKKICEVRPNTAVSDIKSKIKIIRSQFSHEKLHVEKEKVANKNYEPRLWAYKELSFLDRHLQTGVKSFAKHNSESEPNKEPPKVEKKKGSLLGEARAALKYAVKLKTSGPLEETREEIFGKFVALQLKQITDPDIYNETTWAIQVALREGIEKFERIQIS